LNSFVKSHGLGNDYIIFDKNHVQFPLKPSVIQRICHRNYGIGSDGILLFEKIDDENFSVRIFNPDGSEAEKSGNGLRILAKFLYDHGYTKNTKFYINTLGGKVEINLELDNERVKNIEVDMGKIEYIYVDKEIEINNEEKLNIVYLSIGNPHCVFFVDEIDEELIKDLGPKIENHPLFPNRTNVQMVKVISDSTIEIRIWERGAGYTLASGSSSCASACAAYKKGLVKNNVKVIMPGGELYVNIKENGHVFLKGPAQEIFEGTLSKEFLEELIRIP